MLKTSQIATVVLNDVSSGYRLGVKPWNRCGCAGAYCLYIAIACVGGNYADTITIDEYSADRPRDIHIYYKLLDKPLKDKRRLDTAIIK